MALVVLLRGANVGGRRSFRPTALAAELSRLDVVSVGTAGTFVVRRPVGRTALRAEIARRLPFPARITVCEGREVLRLLALDPLAAHRAAPRELVRFVSVLFRAPRRAPDLPLDLPAQGPWMVRVLARHGRFVVGMYRRHMRTIGHLDALDRVFGATATTRSWSTLEAVGHVLSGGGSGTAAGTGVPPGG